MPLDSTHETFYGTSETKPKVDALQATGNSIVHKSRLHAFANFLHFYETTFTTAKNKIQVTKFTTISCEACTISTQTKLQISG